MTEPQVKKEFSFVGNQPLDKHLPAWPDFPAGVPPEDAYAPSGVFFRITNKHTPSKKCLQSDFEKDPDILDERSGLPLICSYGVSLQNTLEGARETVGRFKNATRHRYIATANLSAEVGKIKQTFLKEYHHTLWVYKDVDIHKFFKFLEVVAPK